MFNTPEGSRFLRNSAIAVMVLVAFLAVQIIYTLALTAHIGKDVPPTNVITVSGTGETFAVPDIATFSFGAQATAKTVSDAQKTVTDKINKGIAIVKTAGVADADIKTVGYNINPHYEYNQTICTQFSCPSRQVLTGYDVSQTVEVKVRDTSKAGDILGSLGGVQVTDISGLTFTIDNQDAVQAEARSQAITDARAKAEKLASDLGVSLGRIVSFNEDAGGGPIYSPQSLKASDGAVVASAPQIPVGQNKVTSNVSITYEIR